MAFDALYFQKVWPVKLVKYRAPSGEAGVGLWRHQEIVPLDLTGGQFRSLTDILESDDRSATVEFLIDRKAHAIAEEEAVLLAPLDAQEVWAAGVTYRRSQSARIEESVGAAWCYQKVYDSPRPELFFKATPHRVVGPGQAIRIRQDSAWNVPEPELALVLNTRMQLVGYTIGNDMSSRSIEGENPLYLPQAKLYDGCCSLGPAIILAERLPTADECEIRLTVRRGEHLAFQGQTNTDQMARTFDDLIRWLARENSFPQGVFLLTGTGIVPEASFTLHPGDTVEITIAGLGTLVNPVVQG